ncbi:myosin-like coiled-coil protein-domain-containing protein [Tribonema minus]|uniref:Myosin-like coiled-coil protein-domain-containing protein n=1 Tax=Tribonema minus TaxID=303371 RepID=A0A836CFZ9_9STRA|nr:myosin-like coiled-coil protein-domain-containing protein [Tribonema minus]
MSDPVPDADDSAAASQTEKAHHTDSAANGTDDTTAPAVDDGLGPVRAYLALLQTKVDKLTRQRDAATAEIENSKAQARQFGAVCSRLQALSQGLDVQHRAALEARARAAREEQERRQALNDRFQSMITDMTAEIELNVRVRVSVHLKLNDRFQSVITDMIAEIEVRLAPAHIGRAITSSKLPAARARCCHGQAALERHCCVLLLRVCPPRSRPLGTAAVSECRRRGRAHVHAPPPPRCQAWPHGAHVPPSEHCHGGAARALRCWLAAQTSRALWRRRALPICPLRSCPLSTAAVSECRRRSRTRTHALTRHRHHIVRFSQGACALSLLLFGGVDVTRAVEEARADSETISQELEAVCAREEELRGELVEYAKKFEAFQESLTDTNQRFNNYKSTMSTLNKSVRKLEKKNASLRAADASDKAATALAQINAENSALDAESASLATKRARLEAIIAALQAHMRAQDDGVAAAAAAANGGGGAAIGGSGTGGGAHANGKPAVAAVNGAAAAPAAAAARVGDAVAAAAPAVTMA